MAATQPKIIVLDDDPTGSQTVHSCLLLLKWDVPTLVQGLKDESPIVFILTNTRSLSPAEATEVTTEVCQNLQQAIPQAGIDNSLLVSRSDSTLRGHYPLETDVIAEHLGPFDAHFMVPAFFEGGRITVDSTHYIESGGTRTPTHDTEFAKDSVFGYSTSYLPDYVAEKTKGKISAGDVERFLLADIRSGCVDRLMALENNVCVAVDAEKPADLDQFAADLQTAATAGKRFLFRSAAGLLTALAHLPSQPVAPEQMHTMARSDRGLILVGSHVQKTTRQLNNLLAQPEVMGIEVPVTELRDRPESADAIQRDILAAVASAYDSGQTPAIYTSRGELTFPDRDARLAFGQAISALLMSVVQSLPDSLGYLISKGGITSNDVLSQGLELSAARLLGQIVPGVSIVTTPDNHARFPALPVVLFPGNVGDDAALTLAYQRLQPQR